MKFIVILSIFLITNCGTSGYKILCLLPFHGKSHFVSFAPVLTSLLRRGHELTVISYFPRTLPLLNYTDVSLEGNGVILDDFISLDQINNPIKYVKLIYTLFRYTTIDICAKDLGSNSVKTFLKQNQSFDVVLAEFFTTNCFLSVLHKFPAPLIGLSSSTIMPWTNEYFGNPDNPAYVPINFGTFNDRMSFFERMENAVTYCLTKIVYKLAIDLMGNYYARRFVDKNVPQLQNFAMNISLFLTNSHHSISGPRPFVPNLIEVGGMHVGEQSALPENIEKWINESTHGVIYFSMGSMIKGHTFPEEKRNMFLRAFGRLQQRVLWKWENDTMPKKPDNVMIQKWMPQFDILCHPNVKAFISHGGLLGTTEAVHCGVPAVVMPQYGDQYTNARALEASGGGVILQFSTLTEEDVYNSLKTVLDPSFNKKAKELSERFRDRPMPPLETAIYWVEYVARHKGAPHLRTAAVGMPLYQYLLLDVIAFLLLVFAILTYTSYVVIKFIFRKLFKKQTKEKEN